MGNRWWCLGLVLVGSNAVTNCGDTPTQNYEIDCISEACSELCGDEACLAEDDENVSPFTNDGANLQGVRSDSPKDEASEPSTAEEHPAQVEANFATTRTSSIANVLISEWMASNKAQFVDQNGDDSDWIEIVNIGTESVDLEGFHLSDEYSELDKWTFPSVVLPPGAMVIVWASGNDVTLGNELHAGFKLKSSGEPILLTAPSGEVIDEFPPIEVPSGLSYGRCQNGHVLSGYFTTPSPGQLNGVCAFTEIPSTLQFSTVSGFHDQPFELSITDSNDSGTLHYTLDGTVPTEESPVYSVPLVIESLAGTPNVVSEIPTNHDLVPEILRWKAPLGEVFKATIVRVREVLENGLEGPVETKTFFVGDGVPQKYSLPVISIVTDSDQLFGYEGGIYVPGALWDEHLDFDGKWAAHPANYREKGLDWERPAHFQFFDSNGQLCVSQNVGLRIHGNASRAFALKTLRVYARSEYGNPWLEYPFFTNQEMTRFKRLLIRTGGQAQKDSIFRDAMLHRVFVDAGLTVQASEPVIVFVNGEYWGIHNIRERYDEYYVEEHFGVDDEDVVIIMGGNGSVAVGNPEDNEPFFNLLDFATGNDLSNPENFTYVSELVDLENFINYVIAETYAANANWQDIRLWRKRTDGFVPDVAPGHDGRWRWMLFDLDGAYNWTNHQPDVLGQRIESDPLFAALIETDTFRADFLNRYADLLNSSLRPERILETIDIFESLYAPEIEEHVMRWQIPQSVDVWQNWVINHRDMATNRPDQARDELMDAFDLEGAATLTITSSPPEGGGTVVSTLNLVSDDLPWIGTYFRGVPFPVFAAPAPGWSFVGWTGVESDSPEVMVVLDGDTSLTAHFELDIVE